MESRLIETVRQYILKHRLLTDGARVVAGVSGGADSTALLLILQQLGYSVHAVHCNFHLRGEESERDQQFVTDLCRQHDVELSVCNYDTRGFASAHGVSIEMAARQLRYADFERIRKECGAEAVCIAHHRDDSVETLLLNLIRGTGLRGLTGIKPKNGHIIRPLLCLSRQDIEDWLNQTRQPFVTDSTNLETDFTRNRIRLELLPMMRTINPGADVSIADTIQHLQQAYPFYTQAVERAIDNVVSHDSDIITIDIGRLRQAPSVSGLLFEILSPLGFNDSQITSVATSLDSRPGTTFLSATHRITKERDCLTVSPVSRSVFKPVFLSVEPGSAITLPDGKTLSVTTAVAGTAISKDPHTATFDAALVKGPLEIRPWQDGDSFIPFGMKGRKLVSDYLTDCKVPHAERRQQLVVTSGREIIWILGRRTDNRYRVTKSTTRKLIITLS